LPAAFLIPASYLSIFPSVFYFTTGPTRTKNTRASLASREAMVGKVTPLVPAKRNWLPQGKKQWRILAPFFSQERHEQGAEKTIEDSQGSPVVGQSDKTQ
jgi:hypothetical protein